MALPQASGHGPVALHWKCPGWDRLFLPSLPTRPTTPHSPSVAPHCPQKTAQALPHWYCFS